MNVHLLKNSKGLTLLEMVVAVSLFTTVMVVATTMFLRSISGQSKSVSNKNLQESLNYAMTIISNDAQVALQNPTTCHLLCSDPTAFFCTVNSGTTLIFKNADNNCETIEVENPVDSVPRIKITRKEEFDYVTPTNITISDLHFYIGNTNDATYPIGYATISMIGHDSNQSLNAEVLKLQTTVSIWP